MTPKYWARIVAGMLLVFGFGMLVDHGIGKAKDLFPAPLTLLNAGFRMDGDNLGDIQRLQLMRSVPGHVDSAVVTLKLASDSEAHRFDGCILRVTNARPFGSRTRFVCTSASDSADLELAPFGHVVVQPGDRNVTLYVAGDELDEVQAHAYRGTGSAGPGDVDIQSANNHLTISVNGKVLFQASDESGGGSLVLRGSNGKPIIEIRGDSNGGSFRINDSNGKARVNIHGGSDSGKH